MLEAFTFSCLSRISSEPHELLRNNTQMICQKQASESLFHYNLKPVPLKYNWYLVDLFSILSILLLDVFTTCRKVVIDFDAILITTTISALPDTPAIPLISHLKHPSLPVFLLPLSAPLHKVYSSITFLYHFYRINW